ncbi:MAG: cynT [Candidatus Eremiobacteraeota bacterium]|nr:cynT [Candidatus Eremiobacteraeota bacterium]
MPHSVVDELLYEARLYAARFGQPHSVVPDKHLAIVTCMDSRIDVFGLFGLAIGDAHIIRNAGGIVTDDVLRSLVLSQRVLRTREVILVHHTDCGLQQIHEAEFREKLRADVGEPPPYEFGAFDDVDAAVKRAIQRVREHKFLPSRDLVHGFVYEVKTGVLREPH